MLPIVWLESADEDLAAITEYIGLCDIAAAERLWSRLRTSVLPLSDHPYLYPIGRVSGTRELVAHPNYLIVYRVSSTRIEIVNILHARQEYPQA